jgi:hypothetical protein
MSIGGSDWDVGKSIIVSHDGGYLLIGDTRSNSGDFQGTAKGLPDAFVIKFDEGGTLQWKKRFGGTGNDIANSVITSRDSGFVMAGWTESVTGDFEGMSKGSRDAFVIKMNRDGDVQWKKTFGGYGVDQCYWITATPDGGYLLTGETNSRDGDFNAANVVLFDIFVIKLDSNGNLIWCKTYGLRGTEHGRSIVAAPDGGCVLTGRSNESGSAGISTLRDEVFVMKLDEGGNVEWQKYIGGTGNDIGYSIIRDADDGYALIGWTTSDDGDFEDMNKGKEDVFIIKLNPRGDIEWKKTFGGKGDEECYSIATTPDSGYVLTGWTESNDGDFEGMNQVNAIGNLAREVFVIKLDKRGNVDWKKSFGGRSPDFGASIATAPDKGYILTGGYESRDFTLSGIYRGGGDIFLIKIDSSGSINPSTSVRDDAQPLSILSVTPNPLSAVACISYNVSTPLHVRIEIINSIGETVAVLLDQNEEAGTHRLALNAASLVSGAYILRMTSNEGIATTSVMVVH